jgi:hypothetical protein
MRAQRSRSTSDTYTITDIKSYSQVITISNYLSGTKWCTRSISSRRLLSLLREPNEVRNTIRRLEIRDNPVNHLDHVKRLVLRA